PPRPVLFPYTTIFRSGALYQAYEQLKAKLAQEGVFSRLKRPLVKFPKRIAVITSPSGAVIRDIITTTRRRYPIVQLVLFPAEVQDRKSTRLNSSHVSI